VRDWNSYLKTPIFFLKMLSLSKKVDYALISLAYLVEHRGRISSARAIAAAHDLPLPQLMNVLKVMHSRGILCSERGAKGGYQICTNLDNVSLCELIEAVDGMEDGTSPITRRLSNQPPLRALQYKLMKFLKLIRVSDLVVPGRKIDVPADLLAPGKCRCHDDENARNEAKVAITI
jgi:Rrf2 family protein